MHSIDIWPRFDSHTFSLNIKFNQTYSLCLVKFNIYRKQAASNSMWLNLIQLLIGSDANQEPILERLRNEMNKKPSNENSNTVRSELFAGPSGSASNVVSSTSASASNVDPSTSTSASASNVFPSTPEYVPGAIRKRKRIVHENSGMYFCVTYTNALPMNFVNTCHFYW